MVIECLLVLKHVRQILASLDSAICYSQTHFLLALPVTWGYQTQREYLYTTSLLTES